MDENEKFECPHCLQYISIGYGFDDKVVFDRMGRNWHKKCWEEFEKEYNDVLDSTDLNRKED
jgi:hypothetical protein